MKAVRISLLTLVLLVGATSRPIPTYEQDVPSETYTISQTPGPCYFINGVWVCDR